MNLTYKQFIDNILQTRGRFNCGEEFKKKGLKYYQES